MKILTRTSSRGAPFAASHFHVDLRLLLGFSASLSMIGVAAWSYFLVPEWEENKRVCLYAVLLYALLSAAQYASSRAQGETIFEGHRSHAETGARETLVIQSPAKIPKARYLPADSAEARTARLLPGTTVSSSSSNTDANAQSKKAERPVCIPPQYSLAISYTRTSGGSVVAKQSGSSTSSSSSSGSGASAGQKKQSKAERDALPLGHFGEWFTAEGEFKEAIFEERLRGVIDKVIG